MHFIEALTPTYDVMERAYCNKNSEFWCDVYSTFSLREVDETGNFTEVCPLLEPTSSSSGDYVHPVVVDRDLELRTRNLPEPVSTCN